MNDLYSNSNDQWLHAVSYANRCGGIIPGRGVSFRVKPSTYILKAHWSRWISITVVIAFALFFFFPILLPFLIPIKKEMPLGLSFLVAVVGFFAFYLAVRSSTPIGKIVFDRDSAEIHILYGTIFRPHRITLPSKHINLKAYMFRSDKPDVRIRYGDTVISLIDPNKSDSELILASTKNEKKVYSVIDELNRNFNMGTSSSTSGEGDNVFSSLLKDTAKDEWQQLVDKSRLKKPFLFYPMGQHNLFTKADNEQTMIMNRRPWFLGCFILFFGLFMVLVPFIVMFKEQKFNIFVTLMYFGLSPIFLIPAYITLTLKNKILLKHLDNSVYFEYGCYPFAREISFPRGEFEVSLYRCSLEQANKVKKPGQIVFSINLKKKEHSELILTVAETEPQVISAFDKLKSFLGHSHQRDLTESIELESGEMLKISKSSLLGKNIDSEKRKYYIINDNRVAFKSGWFNVAMYALVFITGFLMLFGVIFMFAEPDDNIPQGILSKVIMFGVCGLMILGGIACFIEFLFKRCIVADQKFDDFYYSPFADINIKKKSIVKLSAIKAIQICSVCTSVQSGNSWITATIYELNAITDHVDNKRIGIACNGKHDQLLNDAESFADFLGVPFIDHTTQ